MRRYASSSSDAQPVRSEPKASSAQCDFFSSSSSLGSSMGISDTRHMFPRPDFYFDSVDFTGKSADLFIILEII